MNGSEEGKALFYHDVEVQGNLILGGSSIQTQLEAKQAKVANVSDTEIGFLDGVTSSLQTQLNNKLGYDSNSSATAKIINLQGLNEFIFQTYVNPQIGFVNPLYIDITNIQGNSYIENTVVIPYLRSPNSMWIEGDLHLVSGSNLYANNTIIQNG